MCLYPRLIKNRKYLPNKKNGGNVPVPCDERVLMVPVGCNNCIECRKQKARAWQVRLLEEVKNDGKGHFVTLTFSNESYAKLYDEVEGEGYEKDNAIVKRAVRYFLERVRKETGKSMKHWLITEIGGERYECIHIHGIIWGDKELIEKKWQYGFVYIGDYLSESTANYVVKYMQKSDPKHPCYKPIILTSAGIGKGYAEKPEGKLNRYKEKETREEYILNNGQKINLPIYYRNKIYTEEEREKLWLEKLDKNIRYVMGKKIDISNEKGWEIYHKTVERQRIRTKRMGFGDGIKDWNKETYERERRIIKQRERIEKVERTTIKKKEWWEELEEKRIEYNKKNN